MARPLGLRLCLRLRLGLLALPGAAAWTRLAVAESDPCSGYGCEVQVPCPEQTWPVACRAEPPHPGQKVWSANGSCFARSGATQEEEIRAKAACSSMFRSFTAPSDPGLPGHAAGCPAGSALEQCYCEAEDCEIQPKIAWTNATDCEAGAQALCLRGATNWLLQNADGLGFVKYCGWVPYQRPLHDPNFRNDTDCRAVMLQPHGEFVGGCASDECQSLEECVSRCDLCANCSAVLYHGRDEGPIRCHMQSSVYAEPLQTSPFPIPWSFYVNERNPGCSADTEPDTLESRGVAGFKLFSDLACSQELEPDEVYALDGSGLVPLRGVWVPSCARAGRCHAGGVSLMATFATRQVVRCAVVDAPQKFGRGWRLAKNSAVLSGGLLVDLAQAEWSEVARSGASLGVRATWDGITEVDVGVSGGSLSSWDAASGGPQNSGDALSILVALLAAGACMVAGAFVYARPLFSGTPQPLRMDGNVAPVMLPPTVVLLEDEEALSPDHIVVDAAAAVEDTRQLTYAAPEAAAKLQELLDFTFLSDRDVRTLSSAAVQGAGGKTIAFRFRQALRLEDNGKLRRYAQRCAAIRRRRPESKPVSPELLPSLAVGKLELGDVLGALDGSTNECYMWYHPSSVRAGLALALGQLAGTSSGTVRQAVGHRSTIRLTESCAKVLDNFPDRCGHYEGSGALLLCRVCLGKFCYTADASTSPVKDPRLGEFDSILEDSDSRQAFLCDWDQVCPEFLVLYSPMQQDEDQPLTPLRLEFPLYWTSLSCDPMTAPFHALCPVSTWQRRHLQRLADRAGPRHLLRRARRIENSQRWLMYSGRSQRGSALKDAPAAEVVAGDLLDRESLLWLASDSEAAARIADKGFHAATGDWMDLDEDLGMCLDRVPKQNGICFLLLCRSVAQIDTCLASMAAQAPPPQSSLGGGSRGAARVAKEKLYPEFLVEFEEKDTE